MKKNLLFLAVALMTTVGFTACSDDDENGSGDKQYTETYRIKYGTTLEVDSVISEQVQSIYDQYSQVLGGSGDSIIITGKDSADCLAQFKSKVTPIESKLDACEYDDEISVEAWSEQGTSVYKHTYGVSNHDISERVNSISTRYFFSYWEKHEYDFDYTRFHKGYVNDMGVSIRSWWQGHKSDSGNYFSSGDLLDGCNGKYVYLQVWATDDASARNVRDLILVKDDRNEYSGTISYNGRWYSRLGSSLNEGTKKGKIMLYCTKDKLTTGDNYQLMVQGFSMIRKSGGTVPTTMDDVRSIYKSYYSFHFTNGDNWLKQTNVEYRFVPTVVRDEHGNFKLEEGDNCGNLYYGEAGSYCYLMAGYQKDAN